MATVIAKLKIHKWELSQFSDEKVQRCVLLKY